LSRSRAVLLTITTVAALIGAPAGAQQATPGTAEQAEARANQTFTVGAGAPCRPSSNSGEIVVCGDSGEDQRIPREDTSTDLGDRRPPDLSPRYPGTVVLRGCFIPPCPPPQPIIIDIAAIPLAPKGSDADLISKGELRGD
jgi:hypothetical protein